MSEDNTQPSDKSGSGDGGPANAGNAGEPQKPVSGNSQNTPQGDRQGQGTADNNAQNQAQSGNQPDQAVDEQTKKAYDELQKKLGSQGQELGEYREFVQGLAPLLSKLDSQPVLLQAILDGKIDEKLVQSVLDGKVEIKEAKEVSDAHDQVKKEMGDEKYQQADPAEIEKKIMEKLGKQFDDTLNKRLSDLDDQRQFETDIQTFINNTPDFADYADKIAEWLNDHPEQDDIEVAYTAVKGKILADAAAQKKEGDDAKNVAGNVSGGESQTAGKPQAGKDVWDQLVGKSSNPNRF